MTKLESTMIVIVLLTVMSCSRGGADQSYGTDYGSPPSKIDEIDKIDKIDKSVSKSDNYYDGDAVTLLPEVKPVSENKIHSVRLDVTHKVVEVADGIKMTLWPFGNDVPGPVIHVREGDTVVFTLANRTTETVDLFPPMPHSIDFHSAMVSPQDKYKTVLPGQAITFEWAANYPGVYMYHCATPPVLYHLANGMYGMVIVEPKEGYPTKVDREYAIVQSEFYPKKKPEANGLYDADMEALDKKQPSVVAFNGRANRHLTEPLKAKPGERVRLYVLNAGPNDTSSFHVIGTIFDRVWIEGNPANELRGLQTVLLGASNGAIVEFVIPEPGKYVMVDHEFADAAHGAFGAIDATQ